jgi:hypothetical protein
MGKMLARFIYTRGVLRDCGVRSLRGHKPEAFDPSRLPELGRMVRRRAAALQSSSALFRVFYFVNWKSAVWLMPSPVSRCTLSQVPA